MQVCNDKERTQSLPAKPACPVSLVTASASRSMSFMRWMRKVIRWRHCNTTQAPLYDRCFHWSSYARASVLAKLDNAWSVPITSANQGDVLKAVITPYTSIQNGFAVFRSHLFLKCGGFPKRRVTVAWCLRPIPSRPRSILLLQAIELQDWMRMNMVDRRTMVS